MNKPYEAPSVFRLSRIAATTGDSRENSTTDTFYGMSGPAQGVGGSHDTCVTLDKINCR